MAVRARKDMAAPASRLQELRCHAIVTISAFAVGVILFGYSYWLANIQATSSTIIALAGLLMLSVLLVASIFAFYYVRAPSAMWLRDQLTIKDLRQRLQPTICLFFSESECVKRLREGRVSHSLGGTRFHDTKSTKTHYLIKSSSTTAAVVQSVEAYVTAVKYRHSHKASAMDKVFEPVRIETISDLTTVSRSCPIFFGVLTHLSSYDRPYLNGRDLPYEYEFIFDKEGSYEITVVAHGQDAPAASITIEMLLRRMDRTDSAGKPFTEYEIGWVRST
jgi:hypothetical protein